MSITFLKDIYANVLSIENADNEQSNLFKELSDLNKGGKQIEKITFAENIGILLETRENVLNSFNSNVFPIENSISELRPNHPVFYSPKRTRARSRISKIEVSLFELNENFVDGIRDEEKYIMNILGIRIHHF